MSEATLSQEPDTPAIVIEPALPSDAEEIAELLRTTWLDTYPNEELGITEEDIRLRTDGEHGERIPQNIEKWRKIVEAEGQSGAVFVARSGDKILGMSAPHISDGIRRVGAVYVLPEAQGMGVGSGLMQKVLEWYGSDEDIYLAVASYNQNAIDFYKRFGFSATDRPITDEGDVYGDKRIPEIEMVLKAKRK